MSEPTCGSCKHWKASPPDPLNLSAPRMGACQEQLHAIVVPGPQGIAVRGLYLPVEATFPACGRYVELVQLEVKT